MGRSGDAKKGRMGWIKLWRQIFDNKDLRESRYSKFDAWLYLLCWAAWATEERIFHRRRFVLGRGQHVTTYRQLARDWGWDHKKAIRFMRTLEDRDMISCEPKNAPLEAEKRPTPGSKTPHSRPKNAPPQIVITICKYDIYQAGPDETPHPGVKNAPLEAEKRPTPGSKTPHDIRIEEERRGEAPISASRTEEEELTESLVLFQGWGLPGPGEREKAIMELRRQGVSHERIRSAAKDNPRSDFYAIFDLLKNSKTRAPMTSGASSGPHHVDPDEARRKDELLVEIGRSIEELPLEEKTVWQREAQERAIREKVYGPAIPLFIQSELRRRMAKKKGVSGI